MSTNITVLSHTSEPAVLEDTRVTDVNDYHVVIDNTDASANIAVLPDTNEHNPNVSESVHLAVVHGVNEYVAVIDDTGESEYLAVVNDTDEFVGVIDGTNEYTAIVNDTGESEYLAILNNTGEPEYLAVLNDTGESEYLAVLNDTGESEFLTVVDDRNGNTAVIDDTGVQEQVAECSVYNEVKEATGEQMYQEVFRETGEQTYREIVEHTSESEYQEVEGNNYSGFYNSWTNGNSRDADAWSNYEAVNFNLDDSGDDNHLLRLKRRHR